MVEVSLSLHLDVPGGFVSAGFDGDGWCFVRTTAPFGPAVDHIGFYRARFDPQRVAQLQRLYCALETAAGGDESPPDEPGVTFGTTRGSAPAAMHSATLRTLTASERAALDAASALVAELSASPVAALAASGALAAASLPPSGPLRFSARFRSTGAEAARWLHAPAALGSGQGLASIEISGRAPGVALDVQKQASAELSARALRLTKPDGTAVSAGREVSTPVGDELVLTGECALRLEPGHYRATLHVQLGEPDDADGSCVFGLWNVDLGEFEVKA